VVLVQRVQSDKAYYMVKRWWQVFADSVFILLVFYGISTELCSYFFKNESGNFAALGIYFGGRKSFFIRELYKQGVLYIFYAFLNKKHLCKMQIFSSRICSPKKKKHTILFEK